MSLYSINDPKHWLDRAKEARALAEQMDDPEAKRTMLKNADDYERLAQRAGERAAGRWPKSKEPRLGPNEVLRGTPAFNLSTVSIPCWSIRRRSMRLVMATIGFCLASREVSTSMSLTCCGSGLSPQRSRG